MSGSLTTITYAEVAALCERLGHDPARVARIVIEPHVVTVEYEHPILGPDPSEVSHPMVQKGPGSEFKP